MERELVKTASHHRIQLGGRRVDYRIVRSPAARKLRIRVGPSGVEVVQPSSRNSKDIAPFLKRNAAWVYDQLRRVDRLRRMRRPQRAETGEILFRGEATRVRLMTARTGSRGNAVSFVDVAIVVERGHNSKTPAARSLENWLRKQARMDIAIHLAEVIARLRQKPGRVYVMGQRTKWGNCSSRRNLSFNWRLILAPSFVLRYVVTHEAVHLAVPDHSAKFWLTVRSLCQETEKAKQWLRAHHAQLVVDLRGVVRKGDG
jgi:predicted metal-dependent hydrolase